MNAENNNQPQAADHDNGHQPQHDKSGGWLWFLKGKPFKFSKILIVLVFFLVLTSVFIPIFVAVLWSFVDPAVPWSYPDIFPKSFSLYHWQHVLKYGEVMRAITTSFIAAPITTAVCIVLALPTSYVLGRKKFRGKGLAKLIVLLPIIMPGIVVAMSLGRLLNNLHLSQTFTGLIIAHTLIGIPYMIRTVTTTFEAIPQDVIDAAYDLGASHLDVVREIYIPLVLPGIFAGGVFTFIYSLEEFILTFIVATPTYRTIPTLLYSYLGYFFQRTNASVVSIILVVPGIVILMVAERFLKKEYLSSGFGKV